MSTYRTLASRPQRRLALASSLLLLATALAHSQTADLPRKPAAKAAKPAMLAGAEPAPQYAALAPRITLAEGKSTLMRLPYAASRISVGDAHTADVILLNPSELYLLGKKPGATNLIVWNKDKEATIVDITVAMDTSALQARISQLFPNETGVVIHSAADTLVLSGMVADAAKADQLLALANAYVRGGASENPGTMGAPGAAAPAATTSRVINLLSIAAPQQVMLEVKVAEVSKTLVDQLGASIGASTNRGNWTYSFLSNLLTNKPGVADAFNKKNGNFFTIDAQKRDGLVKVLAEPTIMAISGQEASFLAGGKIFIPVALTNPGTGVATITLEEKEFGIGVRFTPTVLEGGRINLKVAPEVSDLNKDGIGITATGVSTTAILPSFTTRRASTTVQLFDGQSFAIGGLIKNNVTTNIKAFPLLGEIPVLGALFRSSDFQTDRSELVFIVTPHLVKPLPPDYKLPTDGYTEPSRSQFFLGGRMEGDPKPAPTAAAQAPTGFELH
ncbi:MAG: type II and III secretion system protein family protein [Pseudomonadota bacterium]